MCKEMCVGPKSVFQSHQYFLLFLCSAGTALHSLVRVKPFRSGGKKKDKASTETCSCRHVNARQHIGTWKPYAGTKQIARNMDDVLRIYDMETNDLWCDSRVLYRDGMQVHMYSIPGRDPRVDETITGVQSEPRAVPVVCACRYKFSIQLTLGCC